MMLVFYFVNAFDKGTDAEFVGTEKECIEYVESVMSTNVIYEDEFFEIRDEQGNVIHTICGEDGYY